VSGISAGCREVAHKLRRVDEEVIPVLYLGQAWAVPDPLIWRIMVAVSEQIHSSAIRPPATR
jgi:hypothetical protein